MDSEWLKLAIPALLGVIGTLVGVWFNRRRTAAETRKIGTETDLSAAGFHRESATRAQDRLDQIEARYADLHRDLLANQRALTEQQTEAFKIRLENDRLHGDVETLGDIIARLRSLNIKLRARVGDSGRAERLDELQLNIDTRIERHAKNVEQRGAIERRAARGTAEDRAGADGKP